MENHFRRYSKITLSVLVLILSISLSLTTVYGQEINRKGGLKAWLTERGIDHDQFRQRLLAAIQAQKRHTPDFMEMPGVEGTAIGIRANGEPVIKIFTSRAGIAGIPDRLNGFPVQAEVTGRFVAYYENPRTTLPRPVPIGVSTGHPAITAGTIGARVKDAAGNVYALSNNHVYANMNEAKFEDNVLQAGTVDGGVDPDNAIGTLYDYEPLNFSGGNNAIDAAIALTSKENLRNNTPDNGILYEQFTPSEEIVDPFVGQQVKKYGRTSELTLGQVAEMNVTVSVCYEPVWIFCFKSATFVNQIAVESTNSYPFSQGGDSGSLIVTTEGNNPVGLLFAGSDTRTIANPIGPVLSRFGVTIDGESAEPFNDISIESVNAPTSAIEAGTVDVEVVVANVGNQDVTTDIVVTVEDSVEPNFTPQQTIEGGLAAGESTTVTFSWNAASLGDHTLTASHDFVDDDSTDDYAGTVINVVESSTDVAVTGVTAPASVIEGDIVDVDVVVANVGNQDVTRNIPVTLRDNLDPSFAAEQTIEGGLAAGESTTVTFSWNATLLGDHMLAASHDFVDDDSTNDLASSDVINVVVSLTDVAVTTVSGPSSATAGKTANVDVTVSNVGNQDVGTFDVTLTDITDGAEIGTQTVAGLAAGTPTTLTFSWDTSDASEGNHILKASHNLPDANDTNDADTAAIEITPSEPLGGPQLQTLTVIASTNSWKTVTLDRDYGDEMVVVCSPNYDLSATGPAVVRVKNARGSSFEIGLGRPWYGSFTNEHLSATVHCMVVQKGEYTEAEHGVKMEAVRLENFTSKDNSRSWEGEFQSYANNYTSPVVVGQVLSSSATIPGEIGDWSVFWSRGAKATSPPSSSNLYVGRHTGQDPTWRPAETLMYVVIEAGTGTIEGRRYVAALGADTIRGMQNRPPFTYDLSGLTSASTAVVSQAGMDGGDGGWAVLYGLSPFSATQLKLAIEEDWYWDSERRHTTEQVGYIVFE